MIEFHRYTDSARRFQRCAASESAEGMPEYADVRVGFATRNKVIYIDLCGRHALDLINSINAESATAVDLSTVTDRKFNRETNFSTKYS